MTCQHLGCANPATHVVRIRVVSPSVGIQMIYACEKCMEELKKRRELLMAVPVRGRE